jgi:hypothetical protein
VSTPFWTDFVGCAEVIGPPPIGYVRGGANQTHTSTFESFFLEGCKFFQKLNEFADDFAVGLCESSVEIIGATLYTIPSDLNNCTLMNLAVAFGDITEGQVINGLTHHTEAYYMGMGATKLSSNSLSFASSMSVTPGGMTDVLYLSDLQTAMGQPVVDPILGVYLFTLRGASGAMYKNSGFTSWCY